MNNRIVQIVPTLPPGIDGLGDYALNLARKLQKDWDIQTSFIVGNPQWQKGDFNEFEACAIAQRSPQALLSILPRDRPILLHYSGYGYARRGTPQWLITALKQRTNTHLVTMFHEVYTYDRGPFWSSSFWLSPLQKYLAIQLIKRSDRHFTSREGYAQLLKKLSKQDNLDVAVLPVFSTLCEPDILKPLEQRQRRLVVFGHPNTRQRTYTQHQTQLQQACQVLEIAEIYDIGKPLDLEIQQYCPCPAIEMGITEASKISHIMQDAIAGFLSFPPPEYLGKSTIFAAYCSHGLLPVLTVPTVASVEGLIPEQHYWIAKSENLALSAQKAICTAANTWYQAHNLSQQALLFTQALKF